MVSSMRESLLNVEGDALQVGGGSGAGSDGSVGREAEALILAQLTKHVVGLPYSLVLDLQVQTVQVLPCICERGG